jgi:hypothetical protein
MEADEREEQLTPERADRIALAVTAFGNRDATHSPELLELLAYTLESLSL